MFILRIIKLLLLIISIFSPCCACWCFRDTVSPVKKNYVVRAVNYENLLEEVSDSISSLPRLVIGRGREVPWQDVGCINLRDQDITLDDNRKENPHICGDAWDINTVQQIKDVYTGKFSAIVFERVGPMPLYWSAYLKKLCERPNNIFYQFPAIEQSLVQSSYTQLSEYRVFLKQVYEQRFGFYHELTKVKLPTLRSNIASNSFDINYPTPELVSLVESGESIFQEQIPQLETVLGLQAHIENTVLKAYYKLLKPGGIIIFSSSSSGVNRYGGLVVEYQGRKYTPFKDLDDPSMQAVYRSIFERAGFKNIRFYKDPCYMEDVIFLAATK